MRRLLAGAVVGVVALVLCGGVATTVQAAEPAGPRIAFNELRFREPVAKSYFGSGPSVPAASSRAPCFLEAVTGSALSAP